MDKAKKKRVKRYITWGAMAALVTLLAAMPLLARTNAEVDGPQASILSARVEEGTIQSTLRGGGNLQAEGVEEVTLPSGVKITEFLVKNNQYVTEGTPLASVDKVSVMTAIVEVTDTLEYLEEELEDARDEKISSTITAPAGGRVKKLFAEAGDSVQEVMLRDGCLAILSLDGRMAVKIQRQMDILTGETVTVTLADDTEVEGRVESNLDGVIVITIEDEEYEIGQTVSVTTEDGTRMGQGELYIHNPWKATAYTGTIESVNTKEERTLSSGSTIFTLKDRDFEAELQHRASQHREYEELLQELVQMYQSGYVAAPCDGEVTGVDEDSAFLLSSVPESWVIAPLNATTEEGEKGWTVMLLSTGENDPYPGCSNDASCPSENTDLTKHNVNCIKHCTLLKDCDANTHYSNCKSICTKDSSCEALQHDPTCIKLCKHGKTAEECTAITHYSDCIWSCTHAKQGANCEGTGKHFSTCVEACTSSDGTKDCLATGDHKINCIESCTHADVAGVCPAETGRHYTDCIGCCITSSSKDVVCPSTKHQSSCYFNGMQYTAQAYKLISAGTSELVVFADASGAVYNVVNTGSGWAVVGGQVNTTTLVTQAVIPAANAASFKGKEGSILLVVTGIKGSESVTLNPVVYASGGGMGDFDMNGMSGSLSGMKGSSGMDLSSMIGGLSGYGNYGAAAATEDEGLFDLEGDSFLTVTPREDMTLTIAIDERDISRVALGQKATVTVEALKGESFPAEVTGITLTGTSNGGSSKFDVELTLKAEGDMLSGMSAAAVIPLETRENVPLLPVEALYQEGTKTIVYTALDKDGNPTSPVEVTTGLSDGERVEILSGLELNQQVYYSYYDTLELDTSAEAQKYSFG